jgi:pyruvate oxidase
VLGRSGTPVASWLMNEADLLIVVGASFANHTGIAPYKPILQIDDNPAAIGHFDPVGAGVVGDAALTVDALSRHLPPGAVVTVDVGNHAYSLGRYLESGGQPVLMSGYRGSIGFGYPAAPTGPPTPSCAGRPASRLTGGTSSIRP